jgi:hypothetical protein
MFRGGTPGRALGLLALVLLCAVGLAAPTRSGSVEIEPLFHFHASVAPRAVSASTPTPVTLTFAASPRQSDGSAASSMRSLILDLDRKISFDFAGREICSFGISVKGPFPPFCRKAIVGRGRLAGTVVLPGYEPFPFDVPATVYKAGVEGRATVLGLFVLVREPISFNLNLPIFLRRHGEGPFGYRAKLTLPRLPLNGEGTLSDLEATIGLPLHGNLGGTLTMQCSPGRAVQVRARAGFADGTQLEAQQSRACSPVG